tara:strand:+ start:248 stop:499 length:252 start_codon:yes stop_codon:yes gene_type:complete
MDKKPIIMKTFEIEVVRTYTTTIEVELPDKYYPSYVEEITLGNMPYEEWLSIQDIYSEIWDKIGEGELEQCDTDMQSINVKEL